MCIDRDRWHVPQIARRARVLWLIYSARTLLCALAFWAAGLDLKSALVAVMATINLLGLRLGTVATTFAEV